MADLMQTRKIRSNVDATFQPTYNRMQFDISPRPGMMSDLTESYLTFRMYLTTAINNVQLTHDDYVDLLAKNLMISFGQAGFSYSPAALVKVARLYCGTHLCEEILFANVFTQTIHQLTMDFETLSSSTLESGTVASMNCKGSLAAQISSLIKSSTGSLGAQLPVEVHIPLHELFGVCRNKYFDLNKVGSMRIELELEDVKNLFQLSTVGTPQSIPQTGAVPEVEYHYKPEVSPFTFLPNGQGDMGQPSYKYATTTYDASGNALVIAPMGYKYNVGTTFSPIFFDATNPTTVTVDKIYLEGIWTTQMFADCLFIEGNVLKLNFKWSDSQGRLQSKMIEYLTTIVAVSVDGSSGASYIQTATAFTAPGGIATLNDTNVALDSIEVLVSTTLTAQDQMVVALKTVVTSDPQVGDTTPGEFYSNQIKVTAADLILLEAAGLIVTRPDGSKGSAGGTPFTLYATPSIVDQPVTVWLDQFVNPDSPTLRQIYGGGSKILPIQGPYCEIVGVSAPDPTTQVTTLTLKTLGLENNNSLQFAAASKQGAGYNAVYVQDGVDYPGTSIPAVVNFSLYFCKMRTPTAITDPITQAAFSYQIDRAEITLVESELDESIPMSPVYSTLKVEVVTIETDNLDTYQRQIVVNEPNTYNILCMTPQYNRGGYDQATGTHAYPQSLVSWSRNVNNYRWSINNIDDTNRVVEVQTNTSKYPSSLHLEKLMDTLSNSDAQQKNFSGIMTVPRSQSNPVVCFPLRVYKAIDQLNHYLKPEGFTAQLQLYGDTVHDQPVISGPIFFFKQMLRMLPLGFNQ